MTKIKQNFRNYLSEQTDGDVVVYTIDKRYLVKMINAEIASYNRRNDDPDDNPDYEEIDELTVQDLDKDLLDGIIATYIESFNEHIFNGGLGGQEQYDMTAPYGTWGFIDDYVISLDKSKK